MLQNSRVIYLCIYISTHIYFFQPYIFEQMGSFRVITLWNKQCFCLCIPRLMCTLINAWNVITKPCRSLDPPQIYYIYLAGNNRVLNTNSLLPSNYLSLCYFNSFSLPLPLCLSKWHIPHWRSHSWRVLILRRKSCVHSAQKQYLEIILPCKILFSAFPNTHTFFFCIMVILKLSYAI